VAQRDDLSLGTGLIRKGEARGVSPAMALPSQTPELTEPAPPPAPPHTHTEPYAPPVAEDDPPLRAAPPDDVPKRFTSFRLPVSLDEDLRAMMYETRRSKQDILIDFVTVGINIWRRERAKRK